MRLRRSSSTPSETLPATSRRATLNASRSTPSPTTARASGQRSSPPPRISSTVRPTMKGIATPVPIAAPARAKDTTTARLYGRRKPSSLRNVCIGPLLYFVKRGLPEVEDALHVAPHEGAQREPAERAERQRVLDRVAHQRALGVRLEGVRVAPERVGAAHLHVDEAAAGLPHLDPGEPAQRHAVQPQAVLDQGSGAQLDRPRRDD